MELSPDGRTMATSSFYERAMHFWDTESGRILRTIRARLQECRFFLSPDGRGIIRPIGKNKTERWVFEPFHGEGAVPVEFPENFQPEQMTSPDGDLIYGCYFEPGKGSSEPAGPGHIVWGRWTKDGLKLLGNKNTGIPGLRNPTASPDGKLLAAVDDHGVVVFFSLPRLNVLKKVASMYCRSNFFSRGNIVNTMIFSPDAKILAIGVDASTPGLIRTDTFRKIMPYEGHASGIPTVYFDADGKRLRSIGGDHLICTWDLSTMKMLSRIEIPDDLCVVSVREPDGRYLICSKVVREDNPNGPSSSKNEKEKDKKDAELLRICDAETGKIVTKIAVCQGMFSWIDDREALCLHQSIDDETELCRFNYRNGKVLSVRKVPKEKSEDQLRRGDGQLAEDGRLFYLPDISERCWATLKTAVLDPATGKIEYFQSKEDKRGEWYNRVRARYAGLIPGGKYFYLVDPGFHVYDRRTLRQVSERTLPGTEVLVHTASNDGKLLAVVTGGRIFIEDLFKEYDPGTQSIVRVHDVESGKTLWAFAASTRWVEIKFSPDGRRLAIVNDDGTIEVWPLPKQ
jgi:WD40 repeat protein